MADFYHKARVSQSVNRMAMNSMFGGKTEKHRNNLGPEDGWPSFLGGASAATGWTHLLMKGRMLSPVMGAMDMGMGSGVDSQYE